MSRQQATDWVKYASHAVEYTHEPVAQPTQAIESSRI